MSGDIKLIWEKLGEEMFNEDFLSEGEDVLLSRVCSKTGFVTEGEDDISSGVSSKSKRVIRSEGARLCELIAFDSCSL